jgi:hypothetical protein
MTVVMLVAGGSSRQREEAIVTEIQTSTQTDASIALILEGLPDGTTSLTPDNFTCITYTVRLAPGCPCCLGNLAMRVTLNRVLRHPPARLYIGIATANHLEQVRHFLMQAPYSDLLTLTANIIIQDIPANADKIIRSGIQA